MPRLVLLDDDGRTLFDSPVSEGNVRAVAAFLQRNMPALRAAATVKRAVTDLVDGVGQVADQLGQVLDAVAPRKPRPRSLPRKARR